MLKVYAEDVDKVTNHERDKTFFAIYPMEDKSLLLNTIKVSILPGINLQSGTDTVHIFSGF